MFTFYVLTLFLASLTLAALAVHTYRVPVSAARPFSVMLMFSALFALLQDAAYLVGDSPARIPIAEWIVVPSAFMPVLFVIVALKYTGHFNCLTRPRMALLVSIPILFSGLTLTSTYHTLFRYNYQVAQRGVLSTISASNGPLFYLFLAYVLAGSIVTCILLLRSLKDPQLKPRNTLLVLGGILVPVLSEVTQTAGLTLVPGYNLTPLTFILSGGLFLSAVLQGGLFRAQAMGRSAVMDHMTDLVLVFDRDGKIVDLNEAARAACCESHTDLRRRPVELPQEWADRLRGWQHAYHSKEIILEAAGRRRSYECTSSPVNDDRGHAVGSLMILHDVTARNQAEQVLREQTALAQALRDASAALNSTLDLNDVFTRILENSGRVLEFDSVGILELDPARKNVRLVRRMDVNSAYSMAFDAELWIPVAGMLNLTEVIATGISVIIPDTALYPGWVTIPGEEWVRSNLVAPIVSKGKLIGFLGVNSARVHGFTESSAERMQAFADQAAIAIENARLYENLQELAITDPLTGAFNRHGLLQFGERELVRALRFHRPLSAMIVDMDHFKQINDTFGHPGGDQVLRSVADLCRANLRKVDIFARYGGDEFLMLLPETGAKEALQVAERLLCELANREILVARTDGTIQVAHVTASIGVGTLTAEISTMDALLAHVDQALYQSKHAGRNRVKMVDPDAS